MNLESKVVALTGENSALERVKQARQKIETFRSAPHRTDEFADLERTNPANAQTIKQQAALLLQVIDEVLELYQLESKKSGDLELKGHSVALEGVELAEKAADKFAQLTPASAQAFASTELLAEFGDFLYRNMPIAKASSETLDVKAPRKLDSQYEVKEVDLGKTFAEAKNLSGWQLDGKDAKVDAHYGKVRENYNLNGDTFVSIATDRMSARNVPDLTNIPYKGAVLTSMSKFWEDTAKEVGAKYNIGIQTKDDNVDPNVTVAHNVTPLPVEVVLRRHLTGTAFKRYKRADNATLTDRVFGDHTLAKGLKEHQRLDELIVDPTTKGKDDIPLTDVQAKVLVGSDDWQNVKDFSKALFAKAEEKAAAAGIILADTKFEFGRMKNGDLVIIDEILTPDSSRFWYGGNAEGSFSWALANGKEPASYDKDPIRRWVDEEQAAGKGDAELKANVPDELTLKVANRYIQVHDLITGQSFKPAQQNGSTLDRVKDNLKANSYLKSSQ